MVLSLSLHNTEILGEGHWGMTGEKSVREALLSGSEFYLIIPNECLGCAD